MDILFLPGYACTSGIWQALCEELPGTFTPTLLDWPPSATPNLDNIGDFATWLCRSLAGRRVDCIVGHSLGGLVGLEALAGNDTIARRLVLVESFLVSPGPFFQNLVLREGTTQARALHTMLSEQKPHYSPRLAASLRDIDLRPRATVLVQPVYALYGDRGCGDAARVHAELNWPASVSRRVRVRVIPDSCHFPMVENPHATARELCRILARPLTG